MDTQEPFTATAPPLANLTAGQVLDIHSIVNGISAIKRHQQAISADLNELKTSNQLLWQEALAAREKHKKHQDTIDRILKFLAGVFGNTAEAVQKHDASSESPPATMIPRKRPRLMITGSDDNKANFTSVEEINDHGSDTSRLSPSKLYIRPRDIARIDVFIPCSSVNTTGVSRSHRITFDCTE